MSQGYTGVPDNSAANIPVKVVDTSEISLISTTLGTAVTAGQTVAVTPASMAGIGVGTPLTIDTLASGVQETVLVISVTGTTFTAKFYNTHLSTAVVTLSVERQNMVIADPTNLANVAKVASGQATSADIGITTRPIPTPLTAGTANIGNVGITSPNGSAAGLYANIAPGGSLRVRTQSNTLFTDFFDGALAIDTTNRWNAPTQVNTGTVTAANGVLTLATGTTANAQAALTSIPTFGHEAGGYLNYSNQITLETSVISNTHRFWGFGTPGTTFSAATPLTDAVGFEISTTGVLNAVIYASGSKVFNQALTVPTDGLAHNYVMDVRTSVVYWYVDGTEVPLATASHKNASIQNLPLRYHMVNAASTPASAPIFLATGTFLADTNRQAGSIADGLYAWRRANVQNTATTGSEYGLVTRNIPGGIQSIVANDATISGSLINSGDTVQITSNGLSGWTAQIAGTWSGTVQFEGSVDGSTYVPLNGINASTGLISTTSVSTNGLWRGNLAGFLYFRLRATTALTGSAAVVIRAGAVNAITLNGSLPAGSNYIGSVGPTTTTYPVAGSTAQLNNPTSTAQVPFYSDPNGSLRTVSPDTWITANLAVLNDAITINKNAMNVWNLQITGTWSGVITFESSVDGTNWVSVPGRDITTAASVLVNSVTGNGVYTGSMAGRQFRARLSTATSGTAVVNLRAATGLNGVNLNSALPAGSNNIGMVATTTAPTTPLTNAAGTTGVSLLSDADGSLRTHFADAYANGTLATAGDNVQVIPNGHATWQLYVGGSFTGTIQFEGSQDGLTYQPVYGRNVGLATNALATSTTVTGVFAGNLSGFRFFRARATALTAGSITAYLTASHGTNNVSIGAALPAGTNNVGSFQLGDGTTPTQLAKVLSNGSQVVAFDATSALPAGTSLIGKVGIDQTTPGVTNGVQVNAPLPAGSNVIGGVTQSGTWNVTVNTSLPAGTNLIGKMGIDQTTSGVTNGVVINQPLPTGTNVVGKMGIDQTTPGTSNAVQVTTASPGGATANPSFGRIQDGTSTNLATVTSTGSVQVVSYNDSTNSIGITTGAGAKVIKGTPGRLVSILVTTAPTVDTLIYDNASAASGTIIGLIPAFAPTGYVQVFAAPAANGITAGGVAGSAAFTEISSV